MNGKMSTFEMVSVAGIVAVVILVFVALLGVPVSAQQQTTSAHANHPSNGNQYGNSITTQQQIATSSGRMMSTMMDQLFKTMWISLVSGVKVNGISMIDNQHVSVNLRYDGSGAPPGASVVVVGMAHNSSTTLMGQKEEMMGMIVANNQQSNSSASLDQESQQPQHQKIYNSTSVINNNMQILSMQSGSNYLEAGWQGQGSDSATVLVQLDGDITETGQIIVGVVPFLHH